MAIFDSYVKLPEGSPWFSLSHTYENYEVLSHIVAGSSHSLDKAAILELCRTFNTPKMVWGFHISTISPVYPTISAVYPHYTTLASMIFLVCSYPEHLCLFCLMTWPSADTWGQNSGQVMSFIFLAAVEMPT